MEWESYAATSRVNISCAVIAEDGMQKATAMKNLLFLQDNTGYVRRAKKLLKKPWLAIVFTADVANISATIVKLDRLIILDSATII